MKERAEALVLASFVADSHALGAHWIYDREAIAARYGRVEHLLPPPSDSYHASASRGGFTHYGEQTLLLLESIARLGGFDAAAFMAMWVDFFRSYGGYIDSATRTTLENLTAGVTPLEAGSSSGDASAAARIAPLVYLYRDRLDDLVVAARAQCALTHNSQLVIDTAEFLARVVWNVLNGKTPRGAITAVTESDGTDDVRRIVLAGLESADVETGAAADRFGQHCGTEAALALSVHLIAKHEGSLKDALVDNVAAGGDSAARGLMIGMILGAFHGRDAIPDEWLHDLLAYPRINALLEDLEAKMHRIEQ